MCCRTMNVHNYSYTVRTDAYDKAMVGESQNTHFGRQVSVGNAGQYWRRRRSSGHLSFGPGGRRTVIVDVFGERLRYARVAVVVGVHGQRPDAGHGQRRANVQQNGFHGVRARLCSVHCKAANAFKRHIIIQKKKSHDKGAERTAAKSQ